MPFLGGCTDELGVPFGIATGEWTEVEGAVRKHRDAGVREGDGGEHSGHLVSPKAAARRRIGHEHVGKARPRHGACRLEPGVELAGDLPDPGVEQTGRLEGGLQPSPVGLVEGDSEVAGRIQGRARPAGAVCRPSHQSLGRDDRLGRDPLPLLDSKGAGGPGSLGGIGRPGVALGELFPAGGQQRRERVLESGGTGFREQRDRLPECVQLWQPALLHEGRHLVAQYISGAVYRRGCGVSSRVRLDGCLL